MARCTASRRAQRGRPATAGGHCSVCHGCSLTQNKAYLFERQFELLDGKWLGKMGNMEQGPNGSRDPGIGRDPSHVAALGNTAGAVACEIPTRHPRTDVR